jgi:transcriptional regulator with GAF, ATPase, and Fis domain
MGRPAANQTRNNPMPMTWMTTVAAMIVNVARSMPQIVQASHHSATLLPLKTKRLLAWPIPWTDLTTTNRCSATKARGQRKSFGQNGSSMDLLLLESISLAVAEAREVRTVLNMIVRGLVDTAGLALARIWLRQEPPNESLILAASAGRSLVTGDEWTNLTGRFGVFPLGVRKIGQIGTKGESILLSDVDSSPTWLADPEWARREQIRVFAGHPLVFRGAVLGVLGVFARQKMSDASFRYLRVFADHAAIAIANAEAFEQIKALCDRLEQENDYLRSEVRAPFSGIVGDSDAIMAVERQVELVAPTDANVLLIGETGTGKELFARAIHDRSARASQPLIRVNCASVPRELFESEFFGHTKGAFTGAIRDRVGRFELANGGTLFLDEVGEIPLELQSKLLRVLQEQEFERVGEDRTRRVNVRVVAATNRDLRTEVAQGRFRQDLYFRLSVFVVEIPPLRDRPEDIPALASFFLQNAATRLGRPLPNLSAANLRSLEEYAWPGNVRELQNVIERAIILSVDGVLRFDLPRDRINNKPTQAGVPLSRRDILEAQREQIEQALKRAGGRIYGAGGAAEQLGLRPTTLASKIAALGIEREKKRR